jgi:hypothetical protein
MHPWYSRFACVLGKLASAQYDHVLHSLAREGRLLRWFLYARVHRSVQDSQDELTVSNTDSRRAWRVRREYKILNTRRSAPLSSSQEIYGKPCSLPLAGCVRTATRVRRRGALSWPSPTWCRRSMPVGLPIWLSLEDMHGEQAFMHSFRCVHAPPVCGLSPRSRQPVAGKDGPRSWMDSATDRPASVHAASASQPGVRARVHGAGELMVWSRGILSVLICRCRWRERWADWASRRPQTPGHGVAIVVVRFSCTCTRRALTSLYPGHGRAQRPMVDGRYQPRA